MGPSDSGGFRPTAEYKEATQRGDIAWRVAQRVKDAERSLSAGCLETKEIRNCVDAVLRDVLSLDAEDGRARLVSKWVHYPTEETEDDGVA